MNEINIEETFQKQKRRAQVLRSVSIFNRLEYLKKLKKCLTKYENEIIQAHLEDFRKPANETLLTEILPVHEEINLFLKHLRCWSRPKKVSNSLLLFGSKSFVLSEPKGCVLIIAPWNYPFMLSLVPLVGAIGSGNTVCLKPSELTPKVSQLLSRIVQEVFPPEMAMVIEGGTEISQKLLALPYDHIFFTGSTAVGKIIMEAAAKNLVPVTLELGGKSPVIVDSSADLASAAEKIIWGKSINNGQTCVSPDYVYVHTQVWERFIQECEKALAILQKEHHRPQIITEKHFQRLLHLLKQAESEGVKILVKGQMQGPRDLSPVLLEVTKKNFSTELMQSEIFGPLLPMIKYEQNEEIIDHVNSQGKPLALYIYSSDRQNIQHLIQSISSGGVGINNNILQVANHHLPFGGIGNSGIGKYHGWYSFLEFSHQRGVLQTPGWAHSIFRKFFPPYKKNSEKLVSRMIRLLQRVG